MQPASNSLRILDLVGKQGLVRPVDLAAIDVPRVVLTRMVANGDLERVGRGMYRLPGSNGSATESLSMVASRTPHAVFCLLTALQIHELTTQLPRQVWIAMPRGSHTPRIAYPPLKMIQCHGDAHEAGVEIYQHEHATLRVYSVARTIADCFKHRNLIGLDVALEALKEARAASRLDVDELWYFAKICRVANVMRPYLEALQ
jgi:predicted transcriptional regulator of viral defense system